MAVATFILNGQRYELSTGSVESSLSQMEPEPIREHSVCIGGTWYPVKQAFEAAAGLPRSRFTSHAALRHLRALGFQLRGTVVHRGQAGDETTTPATRPVETAPADPTWFTEARVQASVIAALRRTQWEILSEANTATREHGIDVVAARGGQTAGVEVKGYPGRDYADPRRAGETKKTRPSTQAGHWYAQAVLAAMRLRSKHPAWRSVVALPDFARYQDLYRETSGSLAAARIEVWWVSADGTLTASDR